MLWKSCCLSSLLLLPTGCAPKHKLDGGAARDEIREHSAVSAGAGAGAVAGTAGDNSAVHVPYGRIPGAVVERNSSGVAHQQVQQLRKSLCTKKPTPAQIFYQLIVSEHWHYYWLCSEDRPRRASSRHGAEHIRKWLDGFRRRAAELASRCSPKSRKPVLRGKHISGVRGIAYCNRNINLRFPDGTTAVKGFSETDLRAHPDPAASRPKPCPPPTPCPPPKPCPPPRPCAACDCTDRMMQAGRKGFIQGVGKACSRICGLIYGECRRINSRTAMCHMLQEYCSKNCTS